ncbi:MAG: hypothetical protein ACOYMN_03615 [Roseimicrobium sp.]
MAVNSGLKLTDTAKMRADAIGVAVGLLLLVLLGGIPGQFQNQQAQRAAEIVLLSMVAAIAGLTTASSRPSDLQSRPLAIGIGARLGLRAGFRAAWFGGSVIVLKAVFDVWNAETTAGDIAMRWRSWMTLLVALAGLLPGGLFGFFGGALGALISARRIPKGPITETTMLTWQRWASIAITAAGLITFGSPVFHIGRPLKIDPPPPVIVPPPPPPPPAPFHFVASPDFASAKFGQVTVDTVKTISGVKSHMPMAVKPDFSVFAFCDTSKRSPMISFFDLDWFKNVASIPVAFFPERKLAWSPDFKRLACVSGDGKESRIWILDPESTSSIELPRPKNGDIPSGDYAWWSAKEIAFFPSDEEPLFLDLDKLLLKPIKDSAFLAQADDANKKRWAADGSKDGLPMFSRWTFGVADLIVQNQPPPRRQPDGSWRYGYTQRWAFSDDKSKITHALTSLTVDQGMKCFCAPDASKLILISNDQAQVAYMRLQSPPQWSLEAEMPLVKEGVTEDTTKEQITKNLVCAFVYSPLINPLTGKTVGPDYDHVKATLRLQEWTAGRANFAITQRVQPIEAEDVIATLHTWEAGRILKWRPAESDGWWKLVGKLSDQPAKETETILETPQTLAADWIGDSFVVVPRARTFAPKQQPPPKVAEPSPLPPPPSKPVINEVEEAVKRFVQRHHVNASAGNIDGVMADYADIVDFLDKGRVLKDVIAKDEITHRQNWPRGNESIQGAITLRQNGDAWNASYTVEFRNENDKGDWQSGLVDITIEIRPFKAGYLITSHKAKVHDLKHGSATPKAAPKQSGPPAVNIRLPGPVWAAVNTQNVNGKTYEIHEAVGWTPGHTMIHRTYRELVNAQTPEVVKARHPDGVISMQTAEMEGSLQFTGAEQFTAYFGRQGWVQDKDASSGTWNTEFEKDAARIVGSTFTYHLVGNDLEIEGGRLKLVKGKPKK